MASSVAGQDGGFRVKRIQTNVIALKERQLLDWLCTKLPAWLTSDKLTILGIAGAVLVFASYVASRWNPAFLWLASLGFVVNWFGDSLDGSVARYRRNERPIYGYFLDHTVDAINNLLIMGGIGLTLHVRMDIALFTLVGYYLLCMYVFINNHLSGVFQLSFWGFGPTELRICLIAIDTGMYFAGHAGFALGGEFFSYYDAILMFAATMFVLVFLIRVAIGVRALRDPSRSGSGTSGQSASTNASSAVK